MYNIKIDYMRNHFNFLTGGKIFTKIKKKKMKRQTLQNCEISKNYLRPLWYRSQRVNFEIILILTSPEHCVVSSTTGATKFKITYIKLCVPVVT